MITSPTLTTHSLAESDPRQDALTNHLPMLFPHSPNTFEEEMEEKEYVNQNRQIIGFQFRTVFVFVSDAKKRGRHSAGLISFEQFDPERVRF